MTINTRGGGVTHTHTHTRQGAAVQPSVNPVPSRPLVGGLFHRPSCVCVCALSIGCAPHACEYRLVGCAYAKKSVWSLSYTYTYHTHIPYTQAETAQRTKWCVLCCLWRVFVCVCVVVVVVVGSGSAGGVMWWGSSLLLLLLLLLQQQQQRQI